MPYDPIKGFTPVTLITRGPFVVTGHPSVKAGNLKEFLDVTRAKPNAFHWFGLWVPLNTPRDIVARLNQAVGRALKQPDIQERLRANGMESGHGTPEVFNQFIVEEITKYSRVVKAGNIRVE